MILMSQPLICRKRDNIENLLNTSSTFTIKYGGFI